MTSYILFAAAEVDLREIICYTRKQWGDAQSRRLAVGLRTLTHAAISSYTVGFIAFTPTMLKNIAPAMRLVLHHILPGGISTWGVGMIEFYFIKGATLRLKYNSLASLGNFLPKTILDFGNNAYQRHC